MTSLDSSLKICARAAASGTLASVLSAGALVCCARADAGSPWAALNAPSHWFWGRESLRRNGATWRHTAIGALTHHASSVFWALAYEWLRARQKRSGAGSAIASAAGVTAIAAVVDLKIVPERLTPGFERRLSKRSLAWTYISFGAGLALAGLLAQRRR
jgi:hypothetical protein